MGERVKDKVVIVTGAGSSGPGWGNGKAAAVLYAREGAEVLAADLRQDAAGETQAMITAEGGTCLAFAGDVTKTSDVAAMVAACLAAIVAAPSATAFPTLGEQRVLVLPATWGPEPFSVAR